MGATVDRNLEDMLNRMAPAAAYAKLGTAFNELIKSHNAMLAKLDADAGVTDTNYVATLRVKPLEERI